MRRRHLLMTAGLTLPLMPTLARPARAATYPERPVNMIVAFPPGGGTDVAARTLARFMERGLGQPVVVMNRGGAGGEIGWAELARARPDGYTIGFINTPNILTIPIERRARYKLEDFAPIANIVDDPGGFFVPTDSRFRSLADVVAHAKGNPGAVTYGTTGIGSDDHLATLAFQRLAGIEMTHVPFSGASQVRNAILGKQIDIAAMNIGEGLADMQQGQLRPLGQMAEARWDQAADVPTFREQGFDVVQGSMRGLAAPAGVPREVLDRLAGAVRQALDDPEFRRLAGQQALPLRFLDADAFGAELATMRKGYEALWAAHPWRD